MGLRSRTLAFPFRQALVSARRRKTLSQAQLGKLVGLPQAHISGIESGRIVPRYDTLLELVRVLDYDLVLVPRELVPIVESLVRERDHGSWSVEDAPLYEPDADDGDIAPNPAAKSGRTKGRR